MASRDIMPFISPTDGPRVISYRIGASTTTATGGTSWREGEVVVVDAAGDIDAKADGATATTDAQLVSTAHTDGLIRNDGATSGSATPTTMCPCWVVDERTEFITKNLFNNSDVLVTPLLAHIGDAAGWWRDNTAITTLPNSPADGANGKFGIDLNTTGLIITRVLDSNFVDVGKSAGTGVYVCFRRAS